jgi:hypothetical protein
MDTTNFNNVLQLVQFQKKLLNEILKKNTESKDIEWLLDFPKLGELGLDKEHWKFIKHGVGMRFIRHLPLPNIVVDMHANFFNPSFIDAWRLAQFYNSHDITVDEKKAESILNDLSFQGVLTKDEIGGYLLIEQQGGLCDNTI